MVGYITDLITVSVLVIGITALMGSLVNGIGKYFFGGKKRSEFVEQTEKTQTGWKRIGGKRK